MPVQSNGKLITNDDPRCLDNTLDIICAENRKRGISEVEDVAHVQRAAVAASAAKKKGKGRGKKSPLTVICETQVRQVLVLEPSIKDFGINSKLCRKPEQTIGKLDRIIGDTSIPVSVRVVTSQLRQVLVVAGFTPPSNST